MLMRPRLTTLGLLISTSSYSYAAWLPSKAPVMDRTVRRAVASRAGAAIWDQAAPASLQAICDRRTKSCKLHTAPPPRSGAPIMQEVECPDAPAAVADEGMAKNYVPGEVEERLYKWWEDSDYFKPVADNGKQCFVISMPPPNVTGKLHMGHAMFVALEDIMARFHRMRGNPTLWLPGTDHAGIATQMLVERALKTEGISRVELGRQGFLDRVWDWK